MVPTIFAVVANNPPSRLIVAPQIYPYPNLPVNDRRLGSDFVVGEGRHPLPAEALDHKPSMVQAIAIHDHAAAKDKARPLTRQQIAVKIMIPKVIVGHKGEPVGAQAKIGIHRQAAIKRQANAGPEYGARWQRRPPAIALAVPPADPGRRIIIARQTTAT